MKKCARCGKKGLFLKLINGLCPDCTRLTQIEKEESEVSTRLNELKQQLSDSEALFDRIKTNAEDAARTNMEKELTNKSDELASIVEQLSIVQSEYIQAKERLEKAEKSALNATARSQRYAEQAKRMKDAIESLDSFDTPLFDPSVITSLEKEIGEVLEPTVELRLHYMDSKELRKSFADNKKSIREVLERYKGRYTLKSNETIYQLMVIALEAELQNILYNLKFSTLDVAISDINKMLEKYLLIATSGSQTIAQTIKRFIFEIKDLYIRAVQIEYTYHERLEQQRAEQRALKEQMREEAEDRRRLEQEQKKIEKEETKFKAEMAAAKALLADTTDQDKIAALQEKLEQLQSQLDGLNDKRAEIVSRQNGQAGYVYIISNLGSFGDDVFKVGMTRRLDPQERVDELGDASVPFPFDVHSFIFSENASQLEHNLHVALNQARLNRINLRKEFFKVSLDEIESIVYEYDPSAEFKRTMLAEQYRQSMSIDAVDSDSPEIHDEESA